MNSTLTINSTLAELNLRNATIDASEILLNVYQLFDNDKSLPGLIIVKDNLFHGMLSRVKFFEIMSKQFMYDVFSKRKVEYFFGEGNIENYLVLSASTSVMLATNEALKRQGTEIYEPILVNGGFNQYYILDFYQLLLAQNTIQLLMNDLLRQANEFKKEVLSVVNHDLRSPIGAILGFSNLLESMCTDEKGKTFASYIFQTAKQMEGLVNSFLNTAINGSFDFEINNTFFDVVELLQSVVRNAECQAAKKKQTIRVEFPEHQVMVLSDQLKVKEVMENLLSNAIKYSAEEKEIHVSLIDENEMVHLSVKDEGPGFTETDLKNVFKKFQRLSARPTGDEPSSGLGLYITKRLVDMLQATISLETNPGKGSKFLVTLPREKHADLVRSLEE